MDQEIVIRKNIYSGKSHKLVYTGEGIAWKFVPAESWMPVYINYDVDEATGQKTIVSLDSDGFGYPLEIGEKINNKEVKAIIEVDNDFLVFLD